jgi:hypothetical protein
MDWYLLIWSEKEKGCKTARASRDTRKLVALKVKDSHERNAFQLTQQLKEQLCLGQGQDEEDFSF